MAHLAQAIESISPLDEKAMTAARLRQDSLTKPKGSLGRLEELSIKVVGIKSQAMPSLEHKAIVTMAADHGVTAQGVSLFYRLRCRSGTSSTLPQELGLRSRT